MKLFVLVNIILFFLLRRIILYNACFYENETLRSCTYNIILLKRSSILHDASYL